MPLPYTDIRTDALTVGGDVNIGGALIASGRISASSLPTGTANAVLTTDNSGVPSYTATAVVRGGSNNSSLWTVTTTPTWLNRSWGYLLANYALPVQNLNLSTLNSVSISLSSAIALSYGTNSISAPTLSTNNLTIQTSGFYRFDVNISMNGAGVNTTSMNFQIFVNGATTGNKLYNGVSISGGVSQINGTIFLNLTNGNVVNFRTARILGTKTLNSILNDCTINVTFVPIIGF